MTLVACDRRLQGILATGVKCKRHLLLETTHSLGVNRSVMIDDEDTAMIYPRLKRDVGRGDAAGYKSRSVCLLARTKDYGERSDIVGNGEGEVLLEKPGLPKRCLTLVEESERAEK